MRPIELSKQSRLLAPFLFVSSFCFSQVTEQWVKRYNGPGHGNDQANSLAVDASGNVYVTGEVRAGQETYQKDYATVKYDANGNELWVKQYRGSSVNNTARSLVVDALGNVYVTGNAATIKYDAAGNELWIKRHDDAQVYGNVATSLAVDASGNVYVTGNSYDSTAYNGSVYTDYATVKYDADGKQLWVRRYNGPEKGSDFATSLAVDASGNVYVTGSSDGTGTNSDYATIKYDASGNEAWIRRYNSPENGHDRAASLVVDASGNVYMTGYSFDSNGSNPDYVTIKYSQTQTSAISSFTLINADTDSDIRELKDGDTINLNTLSSPNLNIRANMSPTTVGSVMFNLSGAETGTHTENIVPYALFADDTKSDYYAWTPTNGNYTLTATPYSGSKGSGSAGTPLTIHFTVMGQVVSSLILVNAETDTDIKTLQNGDVINLSTLPTEKLNIRAVVHPDTIGSVVFNLNNRLIVRENLVPYAIGGDIRGNYRAWTLPTGHHNLTATPYDLKYGRGKKGKAHSIAFTVVDMSAITRAVIAERSLTDVAQNSVQYLKAVPNPFTS